MDDHAEPALFRKSYTTPEGSMRYVEHSAEQWMLADYYRYRVELS